VVAPESFLRITNPAEDLHVGLAAGNGSYDQEGFSPRANWFR